MEWWIFVIAFILYLVIVGLIIDINVFFDVSKNYGKLKIKLFKIIPILFVQLKIEGNAINFIGNNKKRKSKQFVINLANINYIKRLKKNIAHRIYINKLNVDIMLSLKNPKYVCLLSSVIKNLLDYFKFKIILTQEESDIKNNIVIGYDENNLLIFGDISVSFSALDFTWALMKTTFEKRRENGK